MTKPKMPTQGQLMYLHRDHLGLTVYEYSVLLLGGRRLWSQKQDGRTFCPQPRVVDAIELGEASISDQMRARLLELKLRVPVDMKPGPARQRRTNRRGNGGQETRRFCAWRDVPREEHRTAQVNTIRGSRRTLEEVGKLMGVTRERTRQLEVNALRKLQLGNRGKAMRRMREDVQEAVAERDSILPRRRGNVWVSTTPEDMHEPEVMRRASWKRGEPVSEEVQEEIRARYVAGETLATLEREYGIRSSTVYRVARNEIRGTAADARDKPGLDVATPEDAANSLLKRLARGTGECTGGAA